MGWSLGRWRVRGTTYSIDYRQCTSLYDRKGSLTISLHKWKCRGEAAGGQHGFDYLDDRFERRHSSKSERLK